MNERAKGVGEIIAWASPYILAAIAGILAWANGIEPMPIPIFAILLVCALVVTLSILVWRAYRRPRDYDDDDMVACLTAWLAQHTWFGLGKDQNISIAINYASVDRRFRFPKGSTKRLLDRAMLHYGNVPASKGKNVAKYTFDNERYRYRN